MKHRSVGFKVGVVAAGLHLLGLVAIHFAVAKSTSSTAGLAFLPFMVLDAPVMLLAELLPRGISNNFLAYPLLPFGIVGSALWFAIPWCVDRLVTWRAPSRHRWLRWAAVISSLPLAVAAFGLLSTFTMALSMRNERPPELRALLTKPAAPGVLAKRTVWEEMALGRVCGIHLVQTGPDGTAEILVTGHRGVRRLDRQYNEQYRLDFSGTYFQTVEPVWRDTFFAGQFLVYKFFEYAALLGPDGQELWRAGDKTEAGLPLAGVRRGDMDGDGQPEFALFRRYRDGITLLDAVGQPRWTHPVYSLGHLEMADVRGNGRQEIIYHERGFKVLDAEGNIVAELKLDTDSSAFALVDWPDRTDRPNLLLTEDNRIRIVDLDGNEIRRLEAPGCRSYGDVAAAPVKFRTGESAWLAVGKNVHPDLAVLFIYDGDGQRVHQEVETRRGSGAPALAAVPAAEPQTERLLVGGGEAGAARLLEYALPGK